MDAIFLVMVNNAREYAGVPFIINSGYRCEKHNREVGSQSANHPSGKAVDIRATDGPTRGKILKGLYRAGFTRIGIGKDFIHADTMDEVESCWLY
jgi:uncharacterized protein YcbK (DUF882 family)